MHIGQPAGSAVPLVWAHAEYLKLLRSATDGRVFDRIDPVYARYCAPGASRKTRRDLEFYSRHRPISSIEAGESLRILEEARFDLMWTCDGWRTKHMSTGKPMGSAGYYVDLTPPRESPEIEWTLHWPERNAWLGYNVKVKIEPVA